MAGNAINFELPSPNAGPYSFAAGQLSGGYQVSSSEHAAQNSGRHSGPDSRPHPAAAETADNAHWEQITGSHRAIDAETPVLISLPRARSRFSMWKVSGVFAGVLLTSVAAISIVVKMATK
jgi:hypothetical protein